jgi:hypothetical protein
MIRERQSKGAGNAVGDMRNGMGGARLGLNRARNRAVRKARSSGRLRHPAIRCGDRQRKLIERGIHPSCAQVEPAMKRIYGCRTASSSPFWRPATESSRRLNGSISSRTASDPPAGVDPRISPWPPWRKILKDI